MKMKEFGSGGARPCRPLGSTNAFKLYSLKPQHSSFSVTMFVVLPDLTFFYYDINYLKYQIF